MAKKKKDSIFSAVRQKAQNIKNNQPRETNTGVTQALIDASIARREEYRKQKESVMPAEVSGGTGRLGAVTKYQGQMATTGTNTYYQDEREARERMRERGKASYSSSSSGNRRFQGYGGAAADPTGLKRDTETRLRDKSNQGYGRMKTYTREDGTAGYYYETKNDNRTGQSEKNLFGNATKTKSYYSGKNNLNLSKTRNNILKEMEKVPEYEDALKSRYYTQESPNTMKYDDGRRVEYFEIQGKGDKQKVVSVPEERYQQTVLLDKGVNASTYTNKERVKDTAIASAKNVYAGAKGFIQGLSADDNKSQRAVEQANKMKDGKPTGQHSLAYYNKAGQATLAGDDARAANLVEQESKIKAKKEEDVLRYQQAVNEELERAKFGASKPMQAFLDVESTAIQMAPGMAVGALVPGGYLTEMAVQSFGNSYNNARLNGATHQQARLSGMQNAAAETLSEMMFTGGRTMGRLTGVKGFFKPGKAVEDVALPFVKSTRGKDLVNAAKKLGLASSEEAAEELVAGIIEPALDNLIYKGEKMDGDWWQDTLHDAAYNAMIGGVLGGMGGSVDIATSIAAGSNIRNNQGVDDLISRGLSMKDGTKANTIARRLQVQAEQDPEGLGNIDVSDLQRAVAQEQQEVRKEVDKKRQVTGDVIRRRGLQDRAQSAEEEYLNQRANAQRAEILRREYEANNLPEEGYEMILASVMASEQPLSVQGEAYKRTFEAAREMIADRIMPSYNQEEVGEDQQESIRERALSDAEMDAASVARVVLGEAREADYTNFSMRNPAAREAYEMLTGQTIPKNANDAREFIIDANENNYIVAQESEMSRVAMRDAAEILGENTAAYKAFRDVFTGETENLSTISENDAHAIVRGFSDAYTIGRASEPDATLPRRTEMMQFLTDDQINAAFEAGKADRFARSEMVKAAEEKIAAAKKIGKRKPKLDHDVASNLNEKERGSEKAKKAIEDMQILQDALNVRITLETARTTADSGNPESSEGWYDKDGIHLNIDADTKVKPLEVVFSHEFTHHLQRYAPKEYQALVEFVIKAKTNNNMQAWERMVEQKMVDYGNAGVELTRDQAIDEIVADMAYEFLNNEQTVERLFAYDATLAEKIKGVMLNMIDKILKFFKTHGSQWKGMEADLNKARQLWLDAAEAARGNADLDIEGDGVQMMLTIVGGKNVKEPGLKEQIDKAKSDLDAMNPIRATITENIGALPYGKRVNAILRQLEDFPLKIESRALGEIVMPGKQALQKAVKHMDDDVALSAFPVMPEVVKHGEIITKVINHRGRRINTYTVASPVELNGVSGYMGVIVRDVEGGLKPYVQQVVFPDGTVFTFEEQNKKGGGTLEPQPERANGSSPTTPSSDKNVSESEQSRNQNTQKEQDAVDFENNVVDSDKQFSISESQMDPGLVKRLNNEKKVKVYRAMQYIDGKLYPPMAAVVKGDLNGGTELGKWEQAEERPDLVVNENGKEYFVLNKGNGKSIKARYNPYIHTSLSPLNDQFSSAYARPNMVVVEGYVPESELTSGYKAEKAKDSVGETQWKAGPVAGKLGKIGKPRRVILSRYFKPERVIPDTEVAGMIADIMDGTGISIPANVVTPTLRAELETAGVEIDYENVPKAFKDSRTQFSLAADQHKIIKANTAWQKYLDGMNRSDIRSFSQVYNNVPADEDPAVDVRYEDLSKASSEGLIGIYSPEPFKQGGYVTTSRALAEDLADGNRVYYAEVEPERIAWKDALQGVYADTGVNETDGRDFLKPDDYVKIRKAIFNKWTELKPDDYDSNYVFTDKYCVFYDVWSATDYDIKKVLDIDKDRIRIKELIDGYDRDPRRITTRLEDLRIQEDGRSSNNASDGNRRNGGQSSGLDRGEQSGEETDLRADSTQSTGAEQEAEQEIGEPSKDDTQFSLSSPVEQKRDLIAVHNLNEEDLMNTIRLGGFPMPSIAVTRTNMGHSKYGTITLLFNKDTIDPKKSKANEIFGGDAYTPTFPAIRIKVNDKVASRISKIYYDLYSRYGYDAVRAMYGIAENLEDKLNSAGGEEALIGELKKDTALKRVFLLTKGKEIENIETRTEERMSDVEIDVCEFLINELGEEIVRDVSTPGGGINHVREWYDKNGEAVRAAYRKLLRDHFGFSEQETKNAEDGMNTMRYATEIRKAKTFMEKGPVTVRTEIDYDATNKAIDVEATKAGYSDWVESLLSGAEEKRGIRNTKELFTPSGNRRNWDALHDSVTLQNVVRAMRSELAAGGNGLFGANPKGAAQKEYKSLDEVRADEGRLEMLPDEEYERLSGEALDRFTAVCESIARHNYQDYDTHFGATLDTGEAIAEVLNETRTKAGIQRTLEEDYHLSVTDAEMNELMDAIDAIANLPTGYFEAKPRRAVGLDEIRTAVIPDTASAELKTALDQNGIEYREYTEGNEEDRKEKVNGAAVEKELQFSLASDRDREIADLQSKVERLQREKHRTYGREASDADATRVARALLADTSSDFSLNQTIKAVKELFTMIKRGDDFADIYGYVQGIARSIADSSYDMVEVEGANELSNLRSYFKDGPQGKMTIKVDPQYKGDFDRYGGWNAFRKKHMGLVTLSLKSGVDADEVVNEIASLFGEHYRPENENSLDTLIQAILDADSREAKHPEEKRYKTDDREGVPEDVDLGVESPLREEEINSIIDRLLDDIGSQIAPMTTFADRKAAEKEAAVKKERDKWKRKRESWKKDRKELIEKLKEERRLAVEAERAKGKEKVRKTEELYRLRIENSRRRNAERSSKRESIRSIEKSAGRLSQALLTPTDAKHVPESYRKVVAQLLTYLDFENVHTDAWTKKYGRPSKRIQAFRDMKDAYEKIIKQDTGFINEDEQFEQWLEYLSDIEGERLSDLDAEQLRTVKMVVQVLEHQVNNANKLLTEGLREGRAEMAEKVHKELKKQKTAKGKDASIQRFIKGDATPVHFFDRLGLDTFKQLWVKLTEAQDRHIRNLDEAMKVTEEISKTYGKKNIKAWSEKAKKYELSNGNTIELTDAQLMSLYALNKREQARGHILGAGVVVAPLKVKRTIKGKLKDGEKERLEQTFTRLSYGDVTRLLKNLSEKQIQAAEEMLSYLKTTSQWGNETSMKLYGYRKFTEDNYFPIQSAREFLNNSSLEDTQEGKIKNIGFTKSIVTGANNPVVLDDFFDVTTSHINQMSQYNTFVPILEDIDRVYHHIEKDEMGLATWSVKGDIRDKHGIAAANYIEQLMRDVNGNVQQEVSDLQAMDNLVRNWKAAKIGLSFRVLLQQPTAVIRAMQYIDPKYFVGTPGGKAALSAVIPETVFGKEVMPKSVKQARDRMYDIVPLAKWKHWGYSQTDIHRSMRDTMMGNEGVLDKVFFDMYGKADDFGWSSIFMAVERETRKEHPELVYDSPEYREHVNKRFREIADRTQVVDSVLHRSEIMREKNILARTMTAFMAEPTATINTLASGISQAREQWRDGNKKPAAKLMTRTGAVFFMNAVAVSLAASLSSTLREAWTGDDDDEKKEKNWIENRLLEAGIEEGSLLYDWLGTYFMQDFRGNINPLSLVPITKDMMSMLEGYDAPNPLFALPSTLLKNMQNLQKWMADPEGQRYTGKYYIERNLEALAELFGVPASNIRKEVDAFTNIYFRAIGEKEYGDYLEDRWMLNDDYSGNKNIFIDHYINAMLRGNVESAEEIRKALIDGGISEEDIVNRSWKTAAPDYKQHVTEGTDYSEDERNLKAVGISEEEITEKRNRYLSSAFEDAIESGNTTRIESIKKKLGESGWGEYDINKKIKSSSMGLIYDALDVEDYSAADRYINVLTENTEYSQADVQDALTTHYMSDYYDAIDTGDEESRLEVRRLLNRYGVSDSAIQEKEAGHYKDYYRQKAYMAWSRGDTDEAYRWATEFNNRYPGVYKKGASGMIYGLQNLTDDTKRKYETSSKYDGWSGIQY